MTLDEAARVLLQGITGCNISEVQRGAGLTSRNAVTRYLEGKDEHRDGSDREKILVYIWRKLNAHVLIELDETRRPCDTRLRRVGRPRFTFREETSKHRPLTEEVT